ncbi:MAG: hypothetical protein V4510_04780 [bacterium]
MNHMKTLAYALAGLVLLLAAPTIAPAATAECMGDICPPATVYGTGGCAVFWYWLEPEPGYQLDPDCL